MLILAVVACTSEPAAPPPTVETIPAEAAPTLPPAPRVGVAEVRTPPGVVRASAVRDEQGDGFVDVCFDADVTTFEGLGVWIDSWGLTRTDGDGACWRVAAPGGAELLARRFVAVPGVAQARPSVTVLPLPSGSVREGSEQYGGVAHTWRIGPDGPAESAGVPRPVLPAALPSAVRACLTPLVADMDVGISAGPGWERAFQPQPAAWVLVVEDASFCGATGWVVLRRDAAVDGLVEPTNDAEVLGSAVVWLAAPRPEDDAVVLAALDLLSEAPDAVLARAVHGAAPGPVQRHLLELFADRSPDGALALSGGSTSPVLIAAAVAQDEELRRRVIADPTAKPSAILAALTAWRPGPSDSVETIDRFLGSTDPAVRARAWEVKAEATEGMCRHRLGTATTPAAAETLYRECPQLDVREAALATVHAADPVRAGALLAETLEAPETPAAGIAAVTTAASSGRMDLLQAVVARETVDRTVRGVALNELVRAGKAGALVDEHGPFLGVSLDEISTATAQTP